MFKCLIITLYKPLLGSKRRTEKEKERDREGEGVQREKESELELGTQSVDV